MWCVLRIPGVRNVLQEWGYLEKGSPRSAVFEKMAIDVDKVYVQSRDALGELTRFLKSHPADLVVIGNDGHTNKSSWLHPSATRRITWDSRTMTMFVPASGGFVSMAHGGFTLRRVLVPVNSRPNPQPAITYAFKPRCSLPRTWSRWICCTWEKSTRACSWICPSATIFNGS